MKNAFKSFILAAIAVQSLVSCQENAPKTVSTDTTSSNAPVVESTPPVAPSPAPMEMPSASPAAPATTTGSTASTPTTVPVVNKTTPVPMPAHPTAPATTTTKGGAAPAPAPVPVSPNSTDAAAKVPPPAPTGKTTSIRWEAPRLTHDWGSATVGDKITHIYKFTNTGTEPLVILDAKASCGCTVPEKPQAPIAPGKSSEIKVVFDSANKPAGATSKTVTVTANTDPGTMVLTLKGDLKLGENKQ